MVLAPQSLSAGWENAEQQGELISQRFFSKGTNESWCFKNSLDYTSIAHILQGIQPKPVSLSLPSRGRQALRDGCSGRSTDSLQALLAGSYREVQNQECAKCTCSCTLVLQALMGSTAREIQGPTINFPFIEFSRGCRLGSETAEPKPS